MTKLPTLGYLNEDLRLACVNLSHLCNRQCPVCVVRPTVLSSDSLECCCWRRRSFGKLSFRSLVLGNDRLQLDLPEFACCWSCTTAQTPALGRHPLQFPIRQRNHLFY